MVLHENGLQPHSGMIPLFSIRIESLASLQSYRRFDAKAWYKPTLITKKYVTALTQMSA